ncbi:hypothetical protein XELAEV_18000540mg [Xenopus laevis]|nr:hypothetical protein XELAEV_18000540mg [Xenopus laevis]
MRKDFVTPEIETSEEIETEVRDSQSSAVPKKPVEKTMRTNRKENPKPVREIRGKAVRSNTNKEGKKDENGWQTVNTKNKTKMQADLLDPGEGSAKESETWGDRAEREEQEELEKIEREEESELEQGNTEEMEIQLPLKKKRGREGSDQTVRKKGDGAKHSSDQDRESVCLEDGMRSRCGPQVKRYGEEAVGLGFGKGSCQRLTCRHAVADCGGGMAASKTSPERHQAPHALVTKTASCAGVRVVSGAGVESGEAVGANSSRHVAAPSVEMHKSLTGNGHLGTPTSEGNYCSDVNEQPQAESLLKGQYAGSNHNQDQTPTTNELVELIKLANEQKLQQKKNKVELQKAFYNYSTADVEKQDFYLAKVNKINEEFRTLEKQILQNYKKIGPLSEVYTNRRRFEDSLQALKQPALTRIGQLKPKKTIVAQIHAPNFIFSLDEANNIEDKMEKRSQSAHKEEESCVFSEQDFPSLPSTSQIDCAHQPSASNETFTQPSANNTETSAVVQSAPMSLALGHGKLSEQELTAVAVSPITTSPLTTPAVSQNPLPTVPSAQPSSVSAPVSSSVKRPNSQQSIPSESAGRRNVPPPPPPNVWNRPLNRMRVPGVQNNITGLVFKQKNVIRLRWQGDKEHLPSRDEIAKEMLLKQSTLTPAGVRAYIKFSDTKYDIVFKTSQALDYDSFKHSGLWESFRVISITKPEKKVTILFKNDCVPSKDILIWLRRHCKVLTPLKMDIDNNGYWSGGWCTNVELYMSERGVVFYPGQPRACFKCGSYHHRASACAVVKCSLCGDLWPHRACPGALHNIMESCPQLEEEMAKDMLEEIRDEMDYFQSDSQPLVIPPSQPHDTVKDQLAVARDASDSVSLTVSSLSQVANNELPVSITEAPIIQPLGIQPLPQRQKPLAQSGKGNCEPADKSPSSQDWTIIKNKDLSGKQSPPKYFLSMKISLENKFEPLKKSWADAMEEQDELERIDMEDEQSVKQCHGQADVGTDSGAEGDTDSKRKEEVVSGSEMECNKLQVRRKIVSVEFREGDKALSDDASEMISLGDDDPIPSGTQIKRFGDQDDRMREGEAPEAVERAEVAHRASKAPVDKEPIPSATPEPNTSKGVPSKIKVLSEPLQGLQIAGASDPSPETSCVDIIKAPVERGNYQSLSQEEFMDGGDIEEEVDTVVTNPSISIIPAEELKMFLESTLGVKLEKKLHMTLEKWHDLTLVISSVRQYIKAKNYGTAEYLRSVKFHKKCLSHQTSVRAKAFTNTQ